MGISVLSETFVEGGLFEPGRYTVDKAEYVTYDYHGKLETVPALHIVATGVEGEVSGKEVNQYYKAGDLKDFAPSQDGKELIAVGKKNALHKNCNAATFFTELANAGAPRVFLEKLGDDISLLEGLDADFGPKSIEWDIKKEKKTSTLFIPTKIYEIPGEEAAAAADAAADEVAEIALKAMATILEANKGKVKRNDIPGKVMALQLGDNQMDVVQLLFKEEFLTEYFTLKGGVVSAKK